MFAPARATSIFFLSNAGSAAAALYTSLAQSFGNREITLTRLAQDLGEDPDLLLAMAGKISADLRSVILARPQLFAEVIRSIKSMPDQAVLRIVREVRDGNW